MTLNSRFIIRIFITIYYYIKLLLSSAIKLLLGWADGGAGAELAANSLAYTKITYWVCLDWPYPANTALDRIDALLK